MNSQFATGKPVASLADIPSNIITHLQQWPFLYGGEAPLYGPKPPEEWVSEVKAKWPTCGIFGHKSEWIAATPNVAYAVPCILMAKDGAKSNPAWTWDDAWTVLAIGPEIGDKTPKPPPGWDTMTIAEKLEWI